MPVNDLFRQRAVEFQLQKRLDTEDPQDYFVRAFGNTLDAGTIADQLAELCGRVSRRRAERDSDRPAQRFINLVHRENDVARWAAFLRHEQARSESVWKGEGLKGLPEALEAWRDSLQRSFEYDPIVRQVAEALEALTRTGIVRRLTPEERWHIGLRAFRTMLWRLQGGGET